MRRRSSDAGDVEFAFVADGLGHVSKGDDQRHHGQHRGDQKAGPPAELAGQPAAAGRLEHRQRMAGPQIGGDGGPARPGGNTALMMARETQDEREGTPARRGPTMRTDTAARPRRAPRRRSTRRCR